MHHLASYLTHTDSTPPWSYGDSVVSVTTGSGKITLFNPATQAWEDRAMPYVGPIQPIANCVLDGVPGSALVDRKPHYVGMILPSNDQTAPMMTFTRGGFTDMAQRYTFVLLPDGSRIPAFAYPGGNYMTLMGMVLPKDGSIGNVMAGPGAGIRCSHLPISWRTSGQGQQSLPVTTEVWGKVIVHNPGAWGSAANDVPEAAIDICQWAWQGPSSGSHFSGRIADSNGPSPATLYLLPYTYQYETGTVAWRTDPQGNPKPMVHQFQSAGQNAIVSFKGVDRAFNDGAFKYGLYAWTDPGQQAYIELEHVINGWI